jgi:predicted hydrocarbon binding protein
MKNSILDDLEYDEERGRISFRDVPYMLIRPDTLVDFQKAVQAQVGDKVAEMMMAGGCTGGSRSSRRYKEIFNYTDEQIVAFMCKMGGEIGWGRFDVEKLDPDSHELIIAVRNSPFAQAYGSSDKGVCHMIRGVLAGLAAGIFGTEVTSEETLCLAKGDELCRFVLRG